jgi:hypothetical protein
MYSKNTTTAPGSRFAHYSELSRAFVDAKPSKKNTEKTVIIPKAIDIDIQE